MGAWASNRVKGIRNYPYSVDKSINPSTYKTLDKPGMWGVHAIGEVWAEMLWVILQRLINKHGFSKDLFPPVPNAEGKIPDDNDFYRPQAYDASGEPLPLVPKHGNTLLLQLVIQAMKIQPCSPSFFNARDAILEADKRLTGGENVCEIWKGFSDRGLGEDAKVVGQTPWGGGLRTDVGLFLHCLWLLILTVVSHRAPRFPRPVSEARTPSRTPSQGSLKRTADPSGCAGRGRTRMAAISFRSFQVGPGLIITR